MLAALNHPNIATIYGLEQSGGTSCLVMELVPGDTLQERVQRDGPVPLEEALAIAKQIGDALEAAHDKGIIHRDLKPANVKVTPEGKVKVLDFGLAKAFSDDASAVDISNSPTLSRAATMQGMILGTAAYMSPEQARGRAVDKRTDIWAYGVVIYEMLTGKRLFTGEDVTETLASVVKDKPDLSIVPARVRPLLERCLEKNPKNRLRDIGDAELLLNAAPEPALAASTITAAPAVRPGCPQKWRGALVYWWPPLPWLGCNCARSRYQSWGRCDSNGSSGKRDSKLSGDVARRQQTGDGCSGERCGKRRSGFVR